jgi:hypothetical protein
MTARRLAALFVFVPFAASAAQDARVVARLDKPTLAAVNAIADSARKVKLPTQPLYDKALEGSAKGSDGQRIIPAVHQLYVRMGAARRVLGTSSSSDEIKAACDAFAAGASEHDLAVLKSVSGKRQMTIPLSVLADLVGRGVPIASANGLVEQLARARVKDADLSLYQRNVRADIEHGADPTVAATTRARGLVLHGAGSSSKPAE